MKISLKFWLYALFLCIFVPIHSDASSTWTIMIYMDADNNLESDGIDDFMEIATTGSDENINYVVQMDRIDGETTSYGNWTDCKRFYVQKGMTPTAQNALSSLGEVNMGDSNTLKDFIQWAMTSYPAQQYALVLWDHGDGWSRKRTRQSPIKSICWDDTNGYEASISMLDLKNILVSLPVKPVLVGFDACLMGMVENAYMLHRAGISVMVGSEETEPAAGWPYDTISQGLASHPQWQATQLGEWIVEKYYQSYDMEETQSAIDLTKMTPLINSLSTLATSIRTSWQNNFEAIHNAAQSLRMRIDDAVISSKNGNAFREAGGLSIYFPTGYINSNYAQTDLAKETSWNEFLTDFHDSMSSSWIDMARNNVLSFDDSDFVDLYHFCTCLEQYDPDDFRPRYTADENGYTFEDIQSSGTKIIIDDEKSIEIKPDNFSFQYHDNVYNSFHISDNGIIFFLNTDDMFDISWATNKSIPSSKPFDGAFIAPFWDDYDGATIFWKMMVSQTGKKLLIQWQDASHYEYTSASTITFQAILYENGQIDFQYKDTVYNNESIDYGKSATVGIQGSSLSGLQYSYNSPKIKSPFGLSFIPEGESECHYSLASYHQNVGSDSEIRTVSLMTEENCEWQAASQVNWISIISEKSGTGPSMIRFQVAENKSMESRSGSLEIANRILTIDQDSPCSYNLSTMKQTVPASGGMQQVTITTSLSACPWTIESLVSWIIPVEPLLAGSGIFQYSVAKNPLMNKRTGNIIINDTTLTVVQDAADVAEIIQLENPSTLKNLSLLLGERFYYKMEIPPDHYSFQLSTNGGSGDCDIYVSHDQVPTEDIYDYSSDSYGNEEKIQIAEPAAGIWYIMIYAYERFQNLTFSVSYQSFKCEYLLSDSSFTFDSESSSDSFHVTTNESCIWQVYTDQTWIKIVNMSEAYQGNTTIQFNLLANTSYVARTGKIVAADHFIEIEQAGNENADFLLLENGIPRLNLEGTENSYQYFKIIVPDNQEELLVKTWGGTGDCDIYMKRNAIPDEDNYDFVSVEYANDENISVQYPQSGEYYVLIFGYESYDNVTIQAEYRNTQCAYSFSQTEINVDSDETMTQIEVTTGDNCLWQAKSLDSWITILSNTAITGSGSANFKILANNSNVQRTGTIEIAGTLIFINQSSSLEVITLLDNQPVTGISISEEEARYFVIDVPANQKNLMIDSWNGSGDVDLYAHYGRVPDDIIPVYECYALGNDENIYIKNPDEGKWYIMLVGYENSDNVSLKATYSTVNCDYHVSPMQTTIDASGGTGILEIVVNEGCSWTAIKHGTWIEIDESTRRGSGNGSVRFSVPKNEEKTIRTNNLRIADQWITAVQLGTEQLTPIVLVPDRPVNIFGEEDSLQYFQVSISEKQSLAFIMSGGTGDCDLYIRHEALPTFRMYDYRPYILGNDESVIIDFAETGTWYMMAHAAADFDDVQLKILYFDYDTNGQLTNLIRVLQLMAGVKIYAMDMNVMDMNNNGWIDIGDALIMLNVERY